MRRSISIGTSLAVAAVVTHGMVFSGVNFDEQPISTYQAFFRNLLLATERLWSYAHGSEPMSHIRDFGHFYAPTIQLICPLVGFALFWTISRHKVGINIWKPLIVAILLSIPPIFSGLVSREAVPLFEVARTTLVTLLMMWSVGAISIPSSVRGSRVLAHG